MVMIWAVVGTCPGAATSFEHGYIIHCQINDGNRLHCFSW